MLRPISICILLLHFSLCTASNYFFHTINVKDGLSDNFIRDITRDSYGYIWFATINGISRYDGYRFCNYMPYQFKGRTSDVTSIRETADSTLWMICAGELFTYSHEKGTWQKDGTEQLDKIGVKGTVKVFFVDDKHYLWVITTYGLFHYDYSTRKLLHIDNFIKTPILHIVSKNGNAFVITTDYKIYEVAINERRLVPITQAPESTYNRDSRVFLDNHENLWIYHSHSLAGTQWLLSLKNREWRQLHEMKQMGNVLVNAITEDNDGNLWVGTGDNGLFMFEYHDGNLGKVTNMNVFLPRSSHISCLYLDDNNTMWLGSSKLGVAYTNLNCPTFNVVSTGDFEDVSSLIQDHDGNLWIGFDGRGIIRKSKNGVITQFSALQKQLPSNIVTSLALKNDGTLLMGTYGRGIAKYNGQSFTPLYSEYSNLNYVKAMTTDAQGNLWVATVDKGVVKVSIDGKIINFTSQNSSLLSNGTLCLCMDSQRDILYIGTSLGISTYDCGKERFIENATMNELKGSYISTLMLDEDHHLWIGSRDGLWIYNIPDGTLDHFTTNQGLSHNTIRALAKSEDCIWASTDNGLTCISIGNTENPRHAYKCYPFLNSDGLHNVVFSNNAALTTEDGTVLLGSFSGYVSINPESVITHYPKLSVQYTDYRINGNMVSQSFSNLTIHHNDRLGISVSAMMPVLSHKVKYLYRFKGKKEWMNAPNNILYFYSLKPGNHVLQVKAELPGQTESEIAELPIKVLPHPLLSGWAKLIYLLILALILHFLNRIVRKRQKHEMAMKQMEVNLKKYEMEEEKIRFFTNISHDLKTPLTLVVAPLEKIRDIKLPTPIRTELDIAWRNARQLYELVLQLLDFRRLDVGREKLNLRHGDIVGFLRQTVEELSYYAVHKQVKTQLRLPATSIEIDFDENKMRRIVTNLLSNAYKYNTENGSVTITLDMAEKDGKRQIIMNVADTGIGIKDKQHVFDRFMQESHGQEQEGSGLGLHIVKEYVNMMGGSIDVADNKPKGTVFTLTIPVVESITPDMEEQPTTESISINNHLVDTEEIQDKPTILVVDDNMDARLFLQRSLDDEYHVLVAANGKEALHILAKNNKVSIVVSDIMMPDMDGLQLFRHIKDNIKYSHIPVILLTAKSSEENIVAGLEEGADDYITKPFSLAVLRLRIRKILEWKEKAHDKIATGVEIEPRKITVSSLDEELISHVISNIEDNMQDINYSVVQLSSDVGMTRGHLYKKLMAITGKSPLEFIRIIKLKRGKSLLDQGKTNISEVADMVGLSAKQFAHYFKMMYNDTPSEYLKKRKNQSE